MALIGDPPEPNGAKPEPLADLDNRIRELARSKPGQGYRKIAATLAAEGYQVSHMRVARILNPLLRKKAKVGPASRPLPVT